MEGERTDMLPSAITFIDNRLCYTSQRCHKIPEALVKLYGSRVHSLDLSYNELVSLKGLERFSFLRELVLDNNHLADSIVFPYLPHLHTLSLNKNQINDIELLMAKISHNLPALTFLSLLGNKACPNELSDLDNDEEDYQRYRYYVLHHAPSLKYLDSTRVTDSERAEANRRGQFMKIVRPKEEENHDVVVQRPLHSYTPLPRNIRNPDDHRGAYSKCKYKYSGKHSEGNRFISNKDL